MFEAEVLSDVLDKAPVGSDVEYETEKIDYTIDHQYNPDIPITLPSGKKFYIEVKGNGRAWTPEVMRKMLAVREQNPDIDIRFVFYRDGKFGNKRKDGSRRSQSEWAEANGFLYSIGFAPQEWFEE